MVPAAVRVVQTLSRSWCGAVDCVSRGTGGWPSSRFLAVSSRGYSSSLGLPDPGFPSEDITAASSASEPPPNAAASSGVPATGGPVADDATPLGPQRTEGNRSIYPPKNYRTPRGVYKAIILGEVGQLPVQKILKSGRSVTIFSVGTGGMYNNRRPFEGESPEEFADRSYTQWHRVTVYQDRVGALVMQHVKVGSQVYLEGNMESRVYNDPNSGIVKRIREIAIRANGRLMFMDLPLGAPRVPAQQQPAPLSSSEAPTAS